MPFGFERGTAMICAGAAVPVAGIGLIALLAMQVGVHGRCVRCLQVVDQRMRLRPVTFSIPPKSGQRSWQTMVWGFVGQ